VKTRIQQRASKAANGASSGDPPKPTSVPTSSEGHRRKTEPTREEKKWLKMEASAEAAAAAAAARTLRWAGRAGHLGGVPRAVVFAAVGAFAKACASLLNTTTVHNADALLRLVSARAPGTPLLTVSNHMSTYVPPVASSRVSLPHGRVLPLMLVDEG
jgi:hypothetical protein